MVNGWSAGRVSIRRRSHLSNALLFKPESTEFLDVLKLSYVVTTQRQLVQNELIVGHLEKPPLGLVF